MSKPDTRACGRQSYLVNAGGPLTQRCPRGRVQFVVIAYQSGLVRPARLRSLNAVSKDPASALRG
jgi:hypothetical protein